MPKSLAADLAAAKATRPVTQRSSIVPELSGSNIGPPGWSAIMPAERELNERWIGHQRIETVEDMLNHYQVAALRQVVRLPAHRYIIELDPQDCDAVAADLIATDLDVPMKGSDERRTGRRAGRFSQRRHFDRAMDALDYGHAVFEHAGYMDAAGYWRLQDLPPVPQWTISDQSSWEIDRHGRLQRVVQHGANPPVKLKTDRLVVFSWQGRPGDPRGRSMLRPLTGAWTLSDRLVRVMGMSGERTGMGIPVGKVGTSHVAGAKEKMERLLAGLAAGHDTNLVLETDEDITKSIMLMGVTGSTPDIVGMLRYLDEVMARAMLAMLLQLNQGGKGGSQALGGTFDDLLGDFQDAVVDWYCDNMTEQLVEPWVDRNRGEDAPAPRLVWRRRDDGDGETDDDEREPVVDADADEIDEPQLPAPVAARQSPRARRPAALDAPVPIHVGDVVREARDDLSLGKAGTVAAQHASVPDGAWRYDVVWEDGTRSNDVREFELRRLDQPGSLAADLCPVCRGDLRHGPHTHAGAVISAAQGD